MSLVRIQPRAFLICLIRLARLLPHMTVRKTPGIRVEPVRNGHGIVALKAFRPGDLVCAIKGTIVSSKQVWKYWDTNPRMAANCMRYDADRYLNPEGEVGAFANHSCQPNSFVLKEGRRLVIRAIKPIAAHDEVTHDYATLIGADDIWKMRCNCGEPRCRKTVQSFHKLPAGVLRKYKALGAIPDFILFTP